MKPEEALEHVRKAIGEAVKKLSNADACNLLTDVIEFASLMREGIREDMSHFQ